MVIILDVNGGGVYKYIRQLNRSGPSSIHVGYSATWEVEQQQAKSNTVYSKGDNLYGLVFSNNSSAYSNNGYQDGYWYIYKGIE